MTWRGRSWLRPLRQGCEAVSRERWSAASVLGLAQAGLESGGGSPQPDGTWPGQAGAASPNTGGVSNRLLLRQLSASGTGPVLPVAARSLDWHGACAVGAVAVRAYSSRPAPTGQPAPPAPPAAKARVQPEEEGVEQGEKPPRPSEAPSWVDSMPAGVRPYLHLIRIDKPIGANEHGDCCYCWWWCGWVVVVGREGDAAAVHHCMLGRSPGGSAAGGVDVCGAKAPADVREDRL